MLIEVYHAGTSHFFYGVTLDYALQKAKKKFKNIHIEYKVIHESFYYSFTICIDESVCSYDIKLPSNDLQTAVDQFIIICSKLFTTRIAVLHSIIRIDVYSGSNIGSCKTTRIRFTWVRKYLRPEIFKYYKI